MATTARRAHSIERSRSSYRAPVSAGGAATLPKPATPLLDRASWFVVAATMLVLPLIVSVQAQESFRLPKELLFKASAIALFALALCRAVLHGRVSERTRWSRPVLIVTAAAVTWCCVTTLTSTNRALSLESLLNVFAATIFLIAVYAGVARQSLTIVYLALVPAIINAVIAVAQRTSVWSPVQLEATYSARFATTALLGNPDDVGMFLMVPALAAVALSLTSRRHRAAAGAIAVVLLCGMIASETAGAIIAFFGGSFLLFFSFTNDVRRVIAGAIVVVIATGAFVRLSPRVWSATEQKIEAAADGDLDPLISGRLPAFLAAWQMFRAHPITGVGLGCFPFHYFDEKIAVEMRHPWLMNRNVVNFGEVHNEHLQALAEGGLPAYSIFVAAFVILGAQSLRAKPAHSTDTAVFARAFALPLAGSLFILMLSSFPLHIAAATAVILFFAGITIAWSEPDARH